LKGQRNAGLFICRKFEFYYTDIKYKQVYNQLVQIYHMDKKT